MNDKKVGFITPQNQYLYMYYDEVNEFCKSICESNEYIKEFHVFSKNYNYFYPYFDFVMFKLNYVFINPLLEEGTCLKRAGNALYKIEKYILDGEQDIYEHISSLAEGIKNGGNYPWLVASSDTELNIRECDVLDIHKCMIDPNGFTLISTNDGEQDGNHEVTSNTIVNQLLIGSKYLWQTYNCNYYAASYLIDKFGFIRQDSIEYDGTMVGVEKLLSEKIKNYRNICVNEKNCVFLDYTKHRRLLNEEAEKYEVGRR